MNRRTFIHELPNGQYELADGEKIEEYLQFERRRLKLLKEMQELKKELMGCKHEVCYDEEGYIYHTRICVKCGRISQL